MALTKKVIFVTVGLYAYAYPDKCYINSGTKNVTFRLHLILRRSGFRDPSVYIERQQAEVVSSPLAFNGEPPPLLVRRAQR